MRMKQLLEKFYTKPANEAAVDIVEKYQQE
jgi:hypothetical protein